MTAVLLLILAGLLGLAGILVAWSPGQPAPLVASNDRRLNYYF
jgi:hypothetical protein